MQGTDTESEAEGYVLIRVPASSRQNLGQSTCRDINVLNVLRKSQICDLPEKKQALCLIISVAVEQTGLSQQHTHSLLRYSVSLILY